MRAMSTDLAPADAHEEPTARPAARPAEEHQHAHAHGSGSVPPAPLRTRIVLACLVLPALLATAFGLWTLWPSEAEVPDRVPVVAPGSAFVDVTVDGAPSDGELAEVPVVLPDGGRSFMQTDPRFELQPGDEVVALHIGDLAESPVPYIFMDFQRDTPFLLLAVAYALVVLLVARWRGLFALAGLAVAFAVFLWFTFPALLAGKDAMAVALVTSAAVMLVVLYVAHGLTARTSVALLGTLAGLALTAAIGSWATDASHLTGAASEDAQVLPAMVPGIDVAGIALCGLVLAGMGVLNDVTITQASAVWELRALAPHAPRRALFVRAMRIGRDHIASTVYTIAFAYVGAALPLLMTVWLMDQPATASLTSGEIAEEVVRTLVGSIGLVLAIPITTAIAAVVVPGPMPVPHLLPGVRGATRPATVEA
jgi:uncharacterized membrane protein